MTEWQNRIVGYGEEAPDQLLANPLNFRIHPRNQQDALAGVLTEVGVVQNVLVNQRSGRLVDGHLRVSLALRQGQASIPVTYVDLSDEEERLILATLDPLAALAGTDAAKLGELLDEVSTADAAVMSMLDELAQKAGVVPENDLNVQPPTPDVIPEQFMILIECRDEQDQIKALGHLQREGYQCRALIS